MYTKFIISICFILLLTSCEDKFTQVKTFDFPEHEEQLAITNLTRSGRFPIPFISHSKAIDDDSPYDTIMDARINFYRDGEFLFDYSHFNAGGYVPNVIVAERLADTIQFGHTYKMEVMHDKYNTSVAEQRVPHNAEIIDMEYTIDGTTNEYGDPLDLLEVTIKDDGSESNFYSIRAFVSGIDQNGNPQANDLWAENQDLLVEYGFSNEYIPDITFNGNEYVIRLGIWQNFRLNNFQSIDFIQVYIRSFSKDYYLYDISKELNDEAMYNPFVEPVLVHSNFSQGYGIFGLFNQTTERLDW
ncbi:MAG: DUF4249 family protein [Bacteroidota bacterium]